MMKGKDETVPNSEVKWLFETQGNSRSRIISPSWEIPSEDTDQPPHRQAANYYKKVANSKDGEFLVTMEEPSIENPKPIQLEIDDDRGVKVV